MESLKLSRVINGSSVKIKQKFKDQPIDQVFTEGRGWEDCEDILNESLIATVTFFNRNQMCKFRLCGDDVKGDYSVAEIVEV
jgi:hypothetical protein